MSARGATCPGFRRVRSPETDADVWCWRRTVRGVLGIELANAWARVACAAWPGTTSSTARPPPHLRRGRRPRARRALHGGPRGGARAFSSWLHLWTDFALSAARRSVMAAPGVMTTSEDPREPATAPAPHDVWRSPPGSACSASAVAPFACRRGRHPPAPSLRSLSRCTAATGDGGLRHRWSDDGRRAVLWIHGTPTSAATTCRRHPRGRHHRGYPGGHPRLRPRLASRSAPATGLARVRCIPPFPASGFAAPVLLVTTACPRPPVLIPCRPIRFLTCLPPATSMRFLRSPFVAAARLAPPARRGVARPAAPGVAGGAARAPSPSRTDGGAVTRDTVAVRHVLVRDGRIAAVWAGGARRVPAGTGQIEGAAGGARQATSHAPLSTTADATRWRRTSSG